MLARHFWSLAAFLLLFRLWLAWALPFSGDEAYFWLWGKFPDWGYYDHPPMIGWWMALWRLVDASPLWLRLPSVLLPLALALSVLAWGKGSQTARYVALCLLLLPPHVWNVLITNDTPLALFVFSAGLFWARALRQTTLAQGNAYGNFALAALCLAGALLSKFFGFMLLLACFCTLLLPEYRGLIKAWKGLGLMLLASVAAVLLMGWWNAENCWANLQFNLVNRPGEMAFNPTYAVVFWLMLTYLLGIVPVFYLLRQPRTMRKRFVAWWQSQQYSKGDKAFDDARVWLLLFAVPLGVFALASFATRVGAHWLLAFLGFFALLLPSVLPEQVLTKNLKFLFWFAMLHALLLTFVVILPQETWQQHRRYDSFVVASQPQALIERLKKSSRPVWFAESYADAAILSRAASALGVHRVLHVFGGGSVHARQDDFLADFRGFDGLDLLILAKEKPDPKNYRPFFKRMSIEPFQLVGHEFYLIYGDDFNYQAYRNKVLVDVNERYYQQPSWLARAAQGSCTFKVRYGL